MGSQFSVANTTKEASIPLIEVKQQMSYIISYWYRSSLYTSENRSYEYPMDILQIIIEHFLYQSEFEILHQKKLKPDAVSKRSYDNRFKLQLMGDSGVGNSSFILRFCNDEFMDTFICTIGIDFTIKTIMIKGEKIKLQIFDMMGYDSSLRINSAFYRSFDGFLMLYDMTDRASFEHITMWDEPIQRLSRENAKRILIACKSDLRDDPDYNNGDIVTYNEGKEIADKLGIQFIETSAKSGKNVNEAMKLIVTEIYDDRKQQERKQLEREQKPFSG